jgi:hypothetical protein
MTSISTLYYERDNEMKLDLYKLINDHLYKLNYKYINKSMELKKYIDNKYVFNITNNKINPAKITYTEWVTTFKLSLDYLQFQKHLDNKIKRSIILSKFIGTNKNKEFYETCTEEELNYLGY